MSEGGEVFALPVRVYFQDTDTGGIVYHANYVKFMERARTEWLRALGYDHTRMMRETGRGFVVRAIKLDYLRPAVLDDLLRVSAVLHSIGYSRMTVDQEVRRGEELLVQGRVHLVCVTMQGFKPVPIPEAVRNLWKGSHEAGT